MGSDKRPNNKYRPWEPRTTVGVDTPCEECTWWDPRGKCVMCGTPKKPNPDYHAPPPVGEIQRFPVSMHRCGVNGFDPYRDTCVGCEQEAVHHLLPPNPAHKLTDNELALRNKRR